MSKVKSKEAAVTADGGWSAYSSENLEMVAINLRRQENVILNS